MKPIVFGVTVASLVLHLSGETSAKTLREFTDDLLGNYPPDSLVDSGVVVGIRPDGSTFIHEYRDTSGFKEPQTAAALTALCPYPPYLLEQNSGAYYYRWCAATGGTYEANRDTWYYSSGRLRLVATAQYDCENATHLAAMPDPVKLAVCY
jgi:hypothetical protein